MGIFESENDLTSIILQEIRAFVSQSFYLKKKHQHVFLVTPVFIEITVQNFGPKLNR